MISCTEVSGSGGCYTANMPSVSAGVYQVYFYDSVTLKCSGQIIWDGTNEVTVASIPTNPLLTPDYLAPDNTGIANIAAKLPSAGAKIAGEGSVAKNLDQVATDLTDITTSLDSIYAKVAPLTYTVNGVTAVIDDSALAKEVSVTNVLAVTLSK